MNGPPSVLETQKVKLVYCANAEIRMHLRTPFGRSYER